jgi:hypothetical protein
MRTIVNIGICATLTAVEDTGSARDWGWTTGNVTPFLSLSVDNAVALSPSLACSPNRS